jgi:hypothetical protein
VSSIIAEADVSYIWHEECQTTTRTSCLSGHASREHGCLVLFAGGVGAGAAPTIVTQPRGVAKGMDVVQLLHALQYEVRELLNAPTCLQFNELNIRTMSDTALTLNL